MDYFSASPTKDPPKGLTGPVVTAPLPVDQVPGRRVTLVTAWEKAGTERRRVTTSDRPNIGGAVCSN